MRLNVKRDLVINQNEVILISVVCSKLLALTSPDENRIDPDSSAVDGPHRLQLVRINIVNYDTIVTGVLCNSDFLLEAAVISGDKQDPFACEIYVRGRGLDRPACVRGIRIDQHTPDTLVGNVKAEVCREVDGFRFNVAAVLNGLVSRNILTCMWGVLTTGNTKMSAFDFWTEKKVTMRVVMICCCNMIGVIQLVILVWHR